MAWSSRDVGFEDAFYNPVNTRIVATIERIDHLQEDVSLQNAPLLPSGINSTTPSITGYIIRGYKHYTRQIVDQR